MTDLPTGTVTFLFTDIEGSTRLLQDLGDRYASIQDEHAAILSRAFDTFGGVVVRIEGDGFFVVFGDPVQAVQASVSAQRGLAGFDWTIDDPPRVRMGLHTGRGVQGGSDYVGVDVNRAARIADSAQGGQVVVSEATKALIEHALPDGVSLRDLGQHRFKGIRHLEHLYDLVVEGLRSEFPPPVSLNARPNNLPAQLTSFIGRTEELEELTRLLGKNRILTLTGPGGIGKTRLALELAAECLQDFSDGAFFVDLSAVTDEDLVPSQILGCFESAGPDSRPIIDQVKGRLRGRELLLIIDNFEQVVDTAPIVEELVMSAEGLKVVVTSRTALTVRGEQEFVVAPLVSTPASELFADRAAAIRPDFEVTGENAGAVAEIVARVDGLPLAIELAATRVKVLTPSEILDRLDDRLSLLSSGSRTLPERHRTLHAVIEWSYDLLSDEERLLLDRLSVFSGGWTIDAAVAVCDFPSLGLDPIDGLGSLVEKSLVLRSVDKGLTRFALLETIREFAAERLDDSPDADNVHRRHAEHFHRFALEAEPHLDRRDLMHWLDLCDREHDNIRAALRWALGTDAAALAQETAGALWRFWQHRGHYAEAKQWFDRILAMPTGQGRTPARARALAGAGGISWWRNGPEAESYYAEALEIEREHGDQKRTAEAVYSCAYVARAKGDFDEDAALLNESLELFRAAGDSLGVARVRSDLAMQLAMADQWDAAAALVEGTIDTLRELGSPFHVGNATGGLMVAYVRTGRMAEARSTALEFVDMAVSSEDPAGSVAAVLFVAYLAFWQGRYEECLQLAGASAHLRDEAGAGPPPEVFEFLVGNPIGDARARLSEDVAQRAWDAGQAMSQEEAIAMTRREAARET